MANISSALHTLYHQKYGMVGDLKNKIGESMFHQLEVMGYVVNAPGIDGDTWRISQSAVRRYEILNRKPTLSEKLKDFYLRKVCNVNLSY